MCDRHVKSEYILIKLSTIISEYIRERTTKFHEEILFDSGVINIQIPMTKYERIWVSNTAFSVAYCSHLSLVNS